MCVEEEIVLNGIEAREDVGREKIKEMRDMRQILGLRKSMLEASRGYELAIVLAFKAMICRREGCRYSPLAEHMAAGFRIYPGFQY